MDQGVKDLLQLVRQMRHAQKQYFRARESADLRESKRLEREVDQQLDRLLEGKTDAPKQEQLI